MFPIPVDTRRYKSQSMGNASVKVEWKSFSQTRA